MTPAGRLVDQPSGKGHGSLASKLQLLQIRPFGSQEFQRLFASLVILSCSFCGISPHLVASLANLGSESCGKSLFG